MRRGGAARPPPSCPCVQVLFYNKWTQAWSSPAAPVLAHAYCCVETATPTGGLTRIAPLDNRRFWAGSTNGTIRFFDGSRVAVQVGRGRGGRLRHYVTRAHHPPAPRLLGRSVRRAARPLRTLPCRPPTTPLPAPAPRVQRVGTNDDGVVDMVGVVNERLAFAVMKSWAGGTAQLLRWDGRAWTPCPLVGFDGSA